MNAVPVPPSSDAAAAAEPKQVRAWIHGDRYVATPVDGPYAEMLYGYGDSYEQAVEKLIQLIHVDADARSADPTVAPEDLELSDAHRRLLKLVARNIPAGRAPSRGREPELVRDLAALDLVEIGPLGARITPAGERQAA